MNAYITTIGERCRMCYTCVRECPAKAIRIVAGQAEVIGDRCIACGNCVRVCSQRAKQIRDTVPQVRELIQSGERVAACFAPSFPAEFIDASAEEVVGMARALGFHLVHEVSFGADLVARQYRRLLGSTNGHRHIATTCPAVASYVQKYYPQMVGSLAPVVSPMIATARVIRALHGREVNVVFIGPCIAKKCEAEAEEVAAEIDGVLTFAEFRRMCQEQGIRPGAIDPSHFDPPHGAAGGLFPISRGILQAAGIEEDLMNGEVVSTQGRAHMIEAIKEFSDGDLGAKLLEALCCEGCIMGAGINNDLPLFNRRRHVRVHVNRRMAALDFEQWQGDMDRFSDLDLRRTFQPNDQRIPLPAPEELTEIMAGMGKYSPDDELNCGACGYDSCREHAVAIYKGLAENEMCLPFMIDQLQCALADIEASNRQLARTQEALMQSEKMASMGQLAAGIAHEVNNPLGVVLMYAHLLLDECQDPRIRDDLTMITEQADRCKKIVAGLLHFARQHKVVRQPVDLRNLIDRTLNATRVPDDISIDVRHDLDDPVVEVDGDQIIQVLTNLVTNAMAAMVHGGRLTICTSGDAHRVSVQVSDTGVGIPKQNLAKIFEPFFTTKESGKGTGLGLAVSYGIIKMHCGDIRVDSQPDPAVGPTWTAFTVTLPRRE